MRILFDLFLTASYLSVSFCGSAAAADDSWQNLKHVAHERYYTVVDRKSNCTTGYIVKSNDHELTLELPNRTSATTFDRANVLRVSVSQAAPIIISEGILIMNMKLEVVVVPVSDVDRAKRFYEKLGFRLDFDYVANEDYRVIQFTPPGSEASIIFGKGVTSTQPGSIDGLVLVVCDIDAARGELLSHGVEVSKVFHDAGGGLVGGFHAGTEARASGPDPQGRSYASYASFSDPDGNGWLLQEIKERLPGRTTHDRSTVK